ncbi:NF038104 family lipoprotein [Zoogloea sp. LCSB751]|uniref:NF038104 family lipoprotein n=1 Tax=Zoogloea sp. LCSB751 TaxID=1965277 RepID=UPI0009A52D6D|nr:NF038104 family lipoprotein [Zoogloea sp. LCSB751]
MSGANRILAAGLLAVACLSLGGCVVGTVVGAAVDVGVEVVKVPFKVGKGIYDVVKDDPEEEKKK